MKYNPLFHIIVDKKLALVYFKQLQLQLRKGPNLL